MTFNAGTHHSAMRLYFHPPSNACAMRKFHALPFVSVIGAIVMTVVAGGGADSDGEADPAAPSAQVLDVFCCLADVLPVNANLRCSGTPVVGTDGVHVTFSRRIALDNLEPSAFRVTTQSGAIRTPRCATLRPALGASKRHTVLLTAELGSERDPPLRIDIVRSVPLLNDGNALGLSSDRITPMALVPEPRIGYRYAPSGLPNAPHPNSTLQIVQITWAGGITAPGGDQPGEAARMGMRVTRSNGVEISPIALADLGDIDKDTPVCLDTQTLANMVTVEPGVGMDPRGGLNPRTSIRVTADPEVVS